jgi:two-component system, chemotaxis family, protein-glutamate methylesterase/glutaminase
MQPERAMETAPPALVCFAASAGGVVALPKVLELLPPDLPLAIVVVQHLSPTHQSRLPEILGRATTMEVKVATHGAKIERGVIYVARPDSHVLVAEDDTLELTQTKKVHYVRPSADLLLSSAARRYSGKVIGVILTGTGSDGSDGIQVVHEAGGIVIVQDPNSASFSGMPESAVKTGHADFVVALEDIAGAIVAILESEAGIEHRST